MRWDDLRYALALGRTGSLVAAGRRLGVDATTVGRRIQGLERALDARLFDRTPQAFVPTMVGERVLDEARRMEAAAATVEQAALGDAERAAGLVRVTTLETLASHVIAPALPGFLARFPEIQLELLTTSRVLRLERAEADVALRLVRPRAETLVGRQVGEVVQAAFVSPGYLAARGLSAEDVGALAEHDALAFSEAPIALPEMRWLLDRAAPPRVVLRTTSISTLLAACRAGLGVAVLPRVLAQGALIELGRLGTPPPRALWRVVHRDVRRVARVRAVVDFIDAVAGRA